MEIPKHIPDTTRRLALAARSHLTELQDEVAKAKRMTTVWQRLDNYVEKKWFIHVSNLLRSERDAILAHPKCSESVRKSLNALAKLAAAEAEQVMRLFPTLIERACSERDVPLDQDSRHPRYSFRNQALCVEIDEKKRVARLSTNESALERLSADVDAVVTAVELELKRLFDRPFNALRFIKSLRKHYVAACKAQKVADGEAVQIGAIIRRLSKNQKAFRTDEFVVDLSRLIDGEVPVVNDRRLDLQQTKDTKRGVLLQGKAARGYVGFVLFRKVASS